jgi:hypothetical protein
LNDSQSFLVSATLIFLSSEAVTTYYSIMSIALILSLLALKDLIKAFSLSLVTSQILTIPFSSAEYNNFPSFEKTT